MSVLDKIKNKLDKIQEMNRRRSGGTEFTNVPLSWIPEGRHTFRILQDHKQNTFSIGWFHKVPVLVTRTREGGETETREVARWVPCPARMEDRACPICELNQKVKDNEWKLPAKFRWSLGASQMTKFIAQLIKTDAKVAENWNPATIQDDKAVGGVTVWISTGFRVSQGVISWLTSLAEDYEDEIEIVEDMFDPTKPTTIVGKMSMVRGQQGSTSITTVPKNRSPIPPAELPDWYAETDIEEVFVNFAELPDDDFYKNLREQSEEYIRGLQKDSGDDSDEEVELSGSTKPTERTKNRNGKKSKVVEETEAKAEDDDEEVEEVNKEVVEESEATEVAKSAPESDKPECFGDPNVFQARSKKCRECPVKRECLLTIASMDDED